MALDDLPAVADNEGSCHYSAWTADLFRASLASGQRCRVVELDGAIAGHGVLSVTGPEAEILNLCIAARLRGRGLGRALLRHLLAVAREDGAEDVFLEVRVSNERARRLYEEEGFLRMGKRPAYYPGPNGREDGLILGRHIGAALFSDPCGA
ncbi:MAG: ribosomal protein S18-alanine N-acetyltransferase [Thiohalorhabdus sp.]|uniref:ribosomal protein S18-alanine N-acetyltransferase n=1 Tax=Thiohalorhabdus sp. TaxID=3094134 RepID=UPI0039804AEE